MIQKATPVVRGPGIHPPDHGTTHGAGPADHPGPVPDHQLSTNPTTPNPQDHPATQNQPADHSKTTHTPRLRYIRATVEAGPRDHHDIGWLPTEGWFCTTCANTRCKHIRTVREHT